MGFDKAIILGSGTSQGVPVIGCSCQVCKSSDSKDQRLRSSLYVEYKGLKLLVDIGPDFRQQMLRQNLSDIDLVLITHEHNDHVAGLDDIRPINFKHNKIIPVYSSQRVIEDIRHRYSYVFTPNPYPGIPRLETHIIPISNLLDFDGTIIEALPILHGGLEIFAFKFGRLAYLCDVSKIDQVVMEKLKGIDILIISALHHRPHPAHYTLSEALDVIEEIKPNTAYITHMSHEMGTNKSLLKMLPSSVFPAYDGQELSF